MIYNQQQIIHHKQTDTQSNSSQNTDDGKNYKYFNNKQTDTQSNVSQKINDGKNYKYFNNKQTDTQSNSSQNTDDGKNYKYSNNKQTDTQSNVSQKTNDGKNLFNSHPNQTNAQILIIKERPQNTQQANFQSNASQKTNDEKNLTSYQYQSDMLITITEEHTQNNFDSCDDLDEASNFTGQVKVTQPSMDVLDEFNNKSRTLLVKMYNIEHLKTPQKFLQYQENDLKNRMGNNEKPVGAFSGSIIDKRIASKLFVSCPCGLIFDDDKVHVFHSLVEDGGIDNQRMYLTKSIKGDDNKLYTIGDGTITRDKIRSLTKPNRPTNNQTIFKATLKHQVKHAAQEGNSTKPLKYTEQVFLPTTTTFHEAVVGVMLDLRSQYNCMDDTEALQYAINMHTDKLNILNNLANELNVKVFIRYIKQDNTTGLMEYKI